MPLMDHHTFVTLLIAITGCGLFLRLVAKEKHRRDRHLDYRLQEKIKEFEKQRQVAQETASKPNLREEPVTAQPIEDAVASSGESASEA